MAPHWKRFSATQNMTQSPLSHLPQDWIPYRHLSTFSPSETNISMSKSYSETKSLNHLLTARSHPPGHPFPSNFGLFWYADQRPFLLKRPRSRLSNWRKLILLSFSTWLSLTNQNSITIQAWNRRNHEPFQLTDIFPFTNQWPRTYTHFFYNHRYLCFSTITMVRYILSYLLLHTLFTTSMNFAIPSRRCQNLSTSTLPQPFTWFRLCWSSMDNVPG